MYISDLLKFISKNPELKTRVGRMLDAETFQMAISGLNGSMDALYAALVAEATHRDHLFILHDKEEAAYFRQDLQSLLPHRKILFFPSSYKKSYEFEEVDNANVLLRAEVLNQLMSASESGYLIITYPDALHEKVINKKSLTENSFPLQVGESLHLDQLTDLLQQYGFEKSDFVYEPGQFSVRGGILDIFSYSNELPYRVELFGDEIESIRTFNPDTQLSEAKELRITIIPDTQHQLLEEQRQSLFSFLPDSALIWFKDFQLTVDILNQYFEKSRTAYEDLSAKSDQTLVIQPPESLYESGNSFKNEITNFKLIHFGILRPLEKTLPVLEIKGASQPSFNKNFELIAENLDEYQQQGYQIMIAADSASQLDRLQDIFEETHPELAIDPLQINLHRGFIDHDLKLLIYTDHQLFERFHRLKQQSRYSKSKAISLRELKTLQPGDYITHIDYGIGRFAGLDKVDVNGKEQEALRIVYRDNDLLYLSVQSLHKIARYTGKEGTPPVMSKLGSQEWENKKKKVKKQVKDIATDLINLYAKRKNASGFAFGSDNFMQTELETSFIYEDTPDQAKATAEVKTDMQSPHPMDRLVCGDVGFGKTEVAIRAAFKAVSNGKQVAILVPTTILAFQHYRTIKERLSNFPVTVDYLNRFRSTAKRKEILSELKSGTLDILIGTHQLVNKEIVFKDLGLLIIDEEQKFGVKVKEKLKELKVNIDVLTLTATPIPRTLHFSLMGARDLSIINTPPPNRQPVTTQVHTFNEEVIRDAISFEIQRGGQVFFVHNRISDIDEIGNIILKLVPDAKIMLAHGQMDGKKLEKAMVMFIEGQYDVLVSTNIIESGLDIPNANTIIINQAHMFGLSDLHQMRGRVGRSNRKAFCYLLAPPTIGLTTEARKRLITLEEFSELGDGFKVAMRDLDIRGAGNLLGAEQSGFINDLGFETYHKILDETVRELKETEFKELFQVSLAEKLKPLVQDCIVETDLELLIPENYVQNISERLELYSRLDNINTEEDLQAFQENILDRFGPVPEPVLALIALVRVRWLAEKSGVVKLLPKNGTMKCYLVEEDNHTFYKSPTFENILEFVQKNPRRCRLKNSRNGPVLHVDEVENVADAAAVFQQFQLVPSQ